jgi:hypothetical protein
MIFSDSRTDDHLEEDEMASNSNTGTGLSGAVEYIKTYDSADEHKEEDGDSEEHDLDTDDLGDDHDVQ